MKKFLFVLAAAALLTGCDSGDDPTDVESDELAGTTWLCSPFEINNGYQYDLSFSFYDDNRVIGCDISWNLDKTDNDVDEFYGTYIYNAPNIRLDMLEEDGEMISYEGTIDGDRMTLYDEGEFFGVFIRDGRPDDSDDDEDDVNFPVLAWREILGGWISDETVVTSSGETLPRLSYEFYENLLVEETTRYPNANDPVTAAGHFTVENKSVFMKFEDHIILGEISGEAVMAIFDYNTDSGLGTLRHVTR